MNDMNEACGVRIGVTGTSGMSAAEALPGAMRQTMVVMAAMNVVMLDRHLPIRIMRDPSSSAILEFDIARP